MKKEYSKPVVSVVEEGALEGVFACFIPSFHPGCGGNHSKPDNNGGYNGSGSQDSVQATPLQPAKPTRPCWPGW